jgi:TolB-like protein/DNA-binding winged helix-turn-helix (wHTH) protein
VRRQRVTRDGETLGLSPLSFELLLALLRAAPDLVSLNELMRRVWPGIVVSPETVSQRVKLVRNALGDDAGAPRYIAGVRGRGYRVIARVSPLEPVAAPTATAPAPSRAPPDGAELPAEAAHATPSAASAGGSPRLEGRVRAWVVFATGAVLAIAALAYPTGAGSPDSARSAATRGMAEVRAGNSLAVLPFANLAGDAASRTFGAGLAEEILHRLSRSRGLRVLARTSSFAHGDSGLDARTLQALLGVRYLLEGSIRREGSELRVTVQLVDESGFRVWSGAWRRKVRDGFAVQDEIAAAVAASVARRVAAVPPAGAGRGVAAAAELSGPPDPRRRLGVGRQRPAFR